MPRIYISKPMAGLRFGKLTVLDLVEIGVCGQHGSGRTKHWRCLCDCGNEKIIRGDSLRSGHIKSCGCLAKEVAAETAKATGHLRRKSRLIVAGQRFGKLVTKKYFDVRKGWLCECDCGREHYARTCGLTKGKTRSCGCEWRQRKGDIMIRRNTTHAMSHLSEYKNWQAMKARCLNPMSPGYDRYGGSGILPCSAMSQSPQALLDSIGSKPSPLHELDRIDNSLGYFCGRCDECIKNHRPTNIRWSTPKEQMRNRRNNRLFTIDGVTQCASAWAEKFGITWAQFVYRYRENRV